MRTPRKIITAVFAMALLLAPSLHAKTGSKPVLTFGCTASAVACNSLALNASKTTDAIDVGGLEWITLTFDYTNDSATAITMTCATSDTATGTFRTIQALVPSGATLASDTLTWSQAVAGDENWSWTVGIYAESYFQCTISATAASVDDTITIGSYGGHS